ncbi:hypothetical protein QT971_01165 [Microcoleus sp. herbarium19]|uniref:hypothetical protein n=1 Tax=unclassified Microcoleus TaxID=2642155 RepID=UPI002FD620D1
MAVIIILSLSLLSNCDRINSIGTIEPIAIMQLAAQAQQSSSLYPRAISLSPIEKHATLPSSILPFDRANRREYEFN